MTTAGVRLTSRVCHAGALVIVIATHTVATGGRACLVDAKPMLKGAAGLSSAWVSGLAGPVPVILEIWVATADRCLSVSGALTLGCGARVRIAWILGSA